MCFQTGFNTLVFFNVNNRTRGVFFVCLKLYFDVFYKCF